MSGLRAIECLAFNSSRLGHSYAPEWGSGGIFGLRSYRGTLYFTVAFDAVAYFFEGCSAAATYDFTLVGPPPTSGGDTYNAVETVDDLIYFGGWVHAPAVFKGRGGSGSEISFRNKYSHVHYYDLSERRVGLLWKDGLGDEYSWAGEVSEIVYDPVNDVLLVARGDGMQRLGVYSLDRRRGYARLLSSERSLKGAVFMDHICFSAQNDDMDLVGIQCYDMVEGRMARRVPVDLKSHSVDGGGVLSPTPGPAVSAYSSYIQMVKGGIVAGDPVNGVEPMRFYRLLDFHRSVYGPLRTVALPLGGGIIVAFNSFTQHVIRREDLYGIRGEVLTGELVGPTVLVYISPPSARIVASLGARVTSIEAVGTHLLIATNTEANLLRYDSTLVDHGSKGILALDVDRIFGAAPPPVTFNVKGNMVGSHEFGGIPLEGYKEPVARIRASKSNRLTLKSYTLDLRGPEAESSTVELKEGLNIIDLSSYRGSIVSFKLERPDHKARIALSLL